MFKMVSIIFGLLLVFTAQAQASLSHHATPQELYKLYRQPHYSEPRLYMMDNPDYQPAMDVARFKYVLFSGSPTNEEAHELKHQIALNLPADMKIVVLVEPSDLAKYQTEYKQWGVADKVVFASSNMHLFFPLKYYSN